MNWHNYIPLAMRTNSDTVGSHGRVSLDLMHGAAGLVTEVKEFLKATDKLHKEEELGDCCWFIALCYFSIAEDDFSISPYSKPASDPLFAAIDLLDIAKRLFAYGKVKDGDKERAVSILNGIIVALNINERHMASNIAKLQARYPEGFSQADALNRDTDAEYMAIRGVE